MVDLLCGDAADDVQQRVCGFYLPVAVFVDELKRQIGPHRRVLLGQGLPRGLQQCLLDDLVCEFPILVVYIYIYISLFGSEFAVST